MVFCSAAVSLAAPSPLAPKSRTSKLTAAASARQKTSQAKTRTKRPIDWAKYIATVWPTQGTRNCMVAVHRAGYNVTQEKMPCSATWAGEGPRWSPSVARRRRPHETDYFRGRASHLSELGARVRPARDRAVPPGV